MDDATSPAAALIEIERVGKIYRNATEALSEVSLSIREGEFVSLLGPSGCGKSTLLRMIAGLSSVTSGRITRPLPGAGGRGEPGRDLGFVFQEPTLMPWATVRENVYLPLKLRHVSRAEARAAVADALAMVGLERFGEAYPRELSGGMKMRVSIARALITKPRLLLMDEPFAALDEITRLRLNDDLLDLWQSQRWTVVFVTHSVFESVFLSSRVVVMSARPGRIVAELAVDAPYPRRGEFRTSAPYNDYCRRATAALNRAMQGGETPE
jgi:NitT/TauT family transport system ATP-binding protein